MLSKKNYTMYELSRVCKQLTLLTIIICVTFVICLYCKAISKESCSSLQEVYNETYPFSKPKYQDEFKIFEIGIITDLDHASKDKTAKHTWNSYFLKGTLHLSTEDYTKSYLIWEQEPITLQSRLSEKGRGMELSDLTIFNGMLLTVDDRSGVVYQIIGSKVIPWIILADGDGSINKGFKAEWLARKGHTLYVGGLGKEWTTTTGDLQNYNPQFVKAIDAYGRVEHLDWRKNYNAMRDGAGFSYPGYMIHESGQWSHHHNRWFFLPRRASKHRYDETADEHRGTNLMFSCSEDFRDIKIINIGDLSNPARGFSAFKFIPGTDERLIVALKSEEDQGRISSYISIFDVDGHIFLPETQIPGAYKYEGIEFL